jgi:hypothetical protein
MMNKCEEMVRSYFWTDRRKSRIGHERGGNKEREN